MSDEDFRKICNTFGFAPSRALRELIDCAMSQAALAKPVQEPVQQALVEADRIMGHDDEATEWRERWAHLFGVAGSATSPWRESAAQGCSLGGTGMPATPPQRPAEPMVWTTQFDINWALNNPGRAGSFYANKEGSNDIALYTTPPVCGRVTEPVQEPVAGRAFLERILTAMEGVIDVADRKTDEFDALRSCVIDLTLMLHTAPPQRKPLPDDQLDDIAVAARKGNLYDLRIAIERAHGIGDNT